MFAAIPPTVLLPIQYAQKLPERRTTGREMIQLTLIQLLLRQALFNLVGIGVKEVIMDRKKVVRYLLIAVGVLIVILLALPLFINANSFRPTIEEKLSAALGRKVQVGDLSLSIFSGSLTASNLSIADDPAFSTSPFLTAKTFRVGVEVWPLITSKTLNVTSLTIENPELNLVRNQQGRWNFSTLGGNTNAQPKTGGGGATPIPEFRVDKLELKDGRATITSGGKPNVYDNVDLEASDVSYKSQFPVQLSANLPGGGTFRLDGKVGPVNVTDSSLTPLDAKVVIKGLDLAKTGFDPGTGIAGIADLENTLASKDGVARAQGSATLAGCNLLKVARRRASRFSWTSSSTTTLPTAPAH